MRTIRYHDLAFDPDMLLARREDGTSIQFTRQERALLLRLSRQPQTLLTRSQILDGLGDDAGSIGERNIDYLVNRLRNRLGDKARNPRFIRTQYGEGYIWIAEPAGEHSTSAFLLVGPVFGMDEHDTATAATLDRLTSVLRRRIDLNKKVSLRTDWKASASRHDQVAYSLEIGTHVEGDCLHLALILRSGPTRLPVKAFRAVVERNKFRETTTLSDIADDVVGSIWNDIALHDGKVSQAGEGPVHLRMHDAAVLLTGEKISWRETEARLLQASEQDRQQPRHAVMLALNRYTRLIQSISSASGDDLDASGWASLETEIEKLAFSALPQIQADPALLLGIAKVLFFIDRGHIELAIRLTEQAFLSTTAFAAAFAMKGQLEACNGEIDRAVSLYDKAAELTEDGSQFHIYLLILKATALLAAQRRTALDHVLAQLHHIDPATRATVAIFFVSSKATRLAYPLEDVFAGLHPEKAADLIFHLYKVSARHFRKPAHRKSIMKGMVAQLVRHHGVDVVQNAVRRGLPSWIGGNRPS